MNTPEKIYLQINDDEDELYAKTTWAADRINDKDVEYVRADIPPTDFISDLDVGLCNYEILNALGGKKLIARDVLRACVKRHYGLDVDDRSIKNASGYLSDETLLSAQ